MTSGEEGTEGSSGGETLESGVGRQDARSVRESKEGTRVGPGVRDKSGETSSEGSDRRQNRGRRENEVESNDQSAQMTIETVEAESHDVSL